MDIRVSIIDYLKSARMMQLATAKGDQPWVCTVYFAVDDELNLYWLSYPTRRHSKEIAENPNVAVTVPIKFDQPVVGVQAEGMASVVDDIETVKIILDRYISKYNAGKDFVNNFVAGKNRHQLYKFTPSRFFLFDEVNYLGEPKELILSHK